MRQVSLPHAREDDYAFIISNVTSGDTDMTNNTTVAGTEIPMIVDSGASCYVMGRNVWETFEQRELTVSHQGT